MSDIAECPYCGKMFQSDEEQDAVTKEGIHRADCDEMSGKDENIVKNVNDHKTDMTNEWKT